MIELKKSPVMFNEEEHVYELDGKRLLGITGLIHQILGLGVYPDASEYVKDYVIPRAGSRGTAVHHAIQTYDLLGVEQNIQTVRTRYGGKGNAYYSDEEWDVTSQLEAYIRHKEFGGFEALANELTVSDNEKWASQIDNVWLNKKTGGIWLVDTKTNNVDLYPLCGYFDPVYFDSGEDALKEYLSWQLSIYAELFEMENPGLKVEGLACNWLREDQSAFWVIDRKPSELVKSLLSTEYMFTDNGAAYFHHDLSVFGISTRTEEGRVVDELAPIIPPDAIDEIAELMRAYEEAKARLEAAKEKLRGTMELNGVKSYNFGAFTATISADSVTTTFDSKRFKAEHGELYQQYTSQKPKRGGFTLKLKEQ